MVWLVVLAACGEPATFFTDPLQLLPPTLGELGITATTAPAELIPYAPVWPFWSSGSDKTRFAFLPSAIDTTIADAWQFPVGTVFVKTFGYAGGPVETRVLRLLDPGWSFDVYRWRDDASDADLVELETRIVVDAAPGPHTIPGRLDCRTCHESAPSPVLGFSELQLADDVLATLDARGLRSQVAGPPVRIPDADPTTHAVLGLFQGNCVQCHHGGAGPNASFDLRFSVALANTIDHPTESSGSAPGIRVVPGDPAHSILYLAYARDTANPDVKAMPPLGIDRADAAGLATLETWIEGLPAAR
ncbi:MAG: hypothetical protein WKG01_03625 [Kofleriaceae bacterium]